ncbi:MAG: SgcJ/EcaC family oxidoreductase [Gammaproteobacteria bacterium]|nr:SgcJ/EcaC family oxidoreductase [Gammaproteobacteria bacterium]
MTSDATLAMQLLVDQWVQAFSAGALEESVLLYTENGAIYSPYGAPALGRGQIRRTHREWLDAGEQNKKIIVVEAHREGDTAYCVAAYAGDYPDEHGNLITESGISVNIAKLQPDGTWRLHISSLNSDTPPLAVSK